MSDIVGLEAAKGQERERIAAWLDERIGLVMQNDREGALELSVAASAIRANKLGPQGMHGDEPILQRDGGHGDDR